MFVYFISRIASSKKHAPFDTVVQKPLTLFLTKTAKNPYIPFGGRTYLNSPYKGVPPGEGGKYGSFTEIGQHVVSITSAPLEPKDFVTPVERLFRTNPLLFRFRCSFI